MTHLGYDKPLYLMAFDHRGLVREGPLRRDSADLGWGARGHRRREEPHLRGVRAGSRGRRTRVTARECSSTRSTAPPLRAPRSTRGSHSRCPSNDQARTSSTSSTATTSARTSRRSTRRSPRSWCATTRKATRRLNERQTERLRRLERLAPRTRPPVPVRAAGAGHRRAARAVRRRRRAATTGTCVLGCSLEIVAAMQAAGVEPDVWKIEGLDAPRGL